MKLRDEIAALREKYFREPSTAKSEIALRRLLDFHDKAIEALRYYQNHYPGIEIRDGGDTASEVLDLLDKEVE